MLSDEIESIRQALAGISGQIDPDAEVIFSQALKNLEAAQDMAENMENNLYVGEVA